MRWIEKIHNKYTLAVLGLILSLVFLIFKAFVGLDQDEQDVYCIMERFLDGERWLVDLYDPRQLGELIVTPLYWVAKHLFSSNPILGYRIISVLILVCLGGVYIFVFA